MAPNIYVIDNFVLTKGHKNYSNNKYINCFVHIILLIYNYNRVQFNFSFCTLLLTK